MNTDNTTKDPAVLENQSRRKAVKTIVGGVTVLTAYHALPVRWGTPIIEQFFLPAHAATSGTSLHDPCEVTWVDGYQDSHVVVIKVSGFVTPPTGGLATKIVATGNPDATATATVNATTAADGTFSATITLNTATGLGTVAVTTTVTGADGSAHCSVNIPQRSGPSNRTPVGESFTVDAQGLNTWSVNLVSHISDADGDALTTTVIGSGVSGGDIVISGAAIVANVATITVSAGTGEGYIDYVVNDGHSNSPTYRITFVDLSGE